MRPYNLFLAAVFTVAMLVVSCTRPSVEVPDMQFVEGGTVVLGSDDADADADEKPLREVAVKSFYISIFEVTQSQWRYVMGEYPSLFVGGNRPVECVSWFDVQLYIQRLNELTGKHFRLPTEVEWEYAARGGKANKPYRYSGGDTIDKVAWWKKNFKNGTSDVGAKSANALGLYDMTGNVHEWCANGYDSLLYSRAEMLLLLVDSLTAEVTVKGGSWHSEARHLRISNRNHISPYVRNATLGFRLAMDAE